MDKINYQKELDKLLDKLSDRNDILHLLLHGCCAPCSSYVLMYLSEYFDITVLFYNPNISTNEEYIKRSKELKRFIGENSYKNKIDYIEADYNPEEFYDAVKGYEKCSEGGERCFLCYELRLLKALKEARRLNCDYYCTTLSISPHKNAAKINEIGYRLAQDSSVLWLPSDFKKKNGFKISTELSKKHNLYRQDYCGCVFSKNSIN